MADISLQGLEFHHDAQSGTYCDEAVHVPVNSGDLSGITHVVGSAPENDNISEIFEFFDLQNAALDPDYLEHPRWLERPRLLELATPDVSGNSDNRNITMLTQSLLQVPRTVDIVSEISLKANIVPKLTNEANNRSRNLPGGDLYSKIHWD